MRSHFFVTILLAALVLGVFSQTKCGNSAPEDFLASGTRKIVKSQYQNSDVVGVSFPLGQFDTGDTSFQVQSIFSIAQIEEPAEKTKIIISVTGDTRIRNTISIKLVVEEKKNWESITVSYFISGSPYFYLGTTSPFIQDKNLRVVGSSHISKQIENPTRLDPNEKFKIVAFISAINTTSSQYEALVNQPSFNIKTGNVTLPFTISSSVQKIAFSYMIYQLQNTPYTYNLYSLTGSYVFSGFTKFYTVLKPRSVFSICKKPECQQNQIRSEITNQCECVEGFLKVGDICKEQCQKFGYLDNYEKCVCLDGYHPIGVNGSCERCRDGFYYDAANNDCYACSAYCITCENSFLCENCLSGFNKVQQDFFGFISSYCESVCGDGKMSQVEECDDQNTENGDGCSDICKIEENFSCYGGTPLTKSICSPYQSNQVYLRIQRIINLANRTAVEVFVDPTVPDCFDAKCTDCEKMFEIEVLQSDFEMKIGIQYFPPNRFIVSFVYPQNQSLLNKFQYSLKFNETYLTNSPYASCFTPQDFKPVFTRIIDPASH